jgi:hypothetical protein
MPAVFNHLGITFQYPENWTLDDDDAVLGKKSVTVYSPGGAFWTVAIHPGTADPEKLAAAVVEVIRKEYQGIDVEDVAEHLEGHDLIGFDLAFYCLDLTNTAHVRGVRVGNSTYTIYSQAEDREYESIKMVFQAMTITLLRGLKDLQYDD